MGQGSVMNDEATPSSLVNPIRSSSGNLQKPLSSGLQSTKYCKPKSATDGASGAEGWPLFPQFDSSLHMWLGCWNGRAA